MTYRGFRGGDLTHIHDVELRKGWKMQRAVSKRKIGRWPMEGDRTFGIIKVIGLDFRRDRERYKESEDLRDRERDRERQREKREERNKTRQRRDIGQRNTLTNSQSQLSSCFLKTKSKTQISG